MTAGQIIFLAVVGPFLIVGSIVIILECRHGQAYNNGPRAAETRRYTASDEHNLIDPIVGDDQLNWPTHDMPAEDDTSLNLREATALALLQPDSTSLPAEEAQR